jgi:Zn finger protein HypA/HybF involved in hydrogenase expression
MTKRDFNINHYMYVKLTEFGKTKIIEKDGPEYFKHCIESHLQPDGYYKLQAHMVMNLLGEYCYNGARHLPFELNVYFTDDDLRGPTGEWSNYSSTMMECSNCKKHVPYHRYVYCPHCGSKNKSER